MIKGAWQQTVTPEEAIVVKGIGLGWLWSLYNLMMLGIALLILLDAPRPSPYEWFDLRRTVRLQVGDRTFYGVTTMISEVGAEVALTQAGFAPPLDDLPPVQIELLEENLTLGGWVERTGVSDEFPTVRILFEEMSLEQQRRLVEILFCRPGQWKTRQSPGEFRSLWLLFRALLKPRVLFGRNADVSPVPVAKV
jgi:hypothetical protein